MVRAASGTPFLLPNPVASMRLEGLLVRITFSRPYERTGRDGVAEPLGMQRRVPKNHPGYKRHTPQNRSERKRVRDLQVEVKPPCVRPNSPQSDR